MKLPKIDLASLPDLDTLTGVFGSVQSSLGMHDDTIVVLATVLFERQPPGSGII